MCHLFATDYLIIKEELSTSNRNRAAFVDNYALDDVEHLNNVCDNFSMSKVIVRVL